MPWPHKTVNKHSNITNKKFTPFTKNKFLNINKIKYIYLYIDYTPIPLHPPFTPAQSLPLPYRPFLPTLRIPTPAPRLRLLWVGGVSFQDDPESWEEHIVIPARRKALHPSFPFVSCHLFCVGNSRRETKKKKCQLRDSLALNCPRLPCMVHRDWLVQKKKKPFV